jgi:hypothetical protein
MADHPNLPPVIATKRANSSAVMYLLFFASGGGASGGFIPNATAIAMTSAPVGGLLRQCRNSIPTSWSVIALISAGV